MFILIIILALRGGGNISMAVGVEEAGSKILSRVKGFSASTHPSRAARGQPMRSLLIGMCTSFTKKPRKPSDKKPTPIANAKRVNSAIGDGAKYQDKIRARSQICVNSDLERHLSGLVWCICGREMQTPWRTSSWA